MTKTKEIVILLIVAAIVVTAWWWLKPSTLFAPVLEKESVATTTKETVDTSNWLTYRDEKYGFELKYPAEYYIQGLGTGGDVKVPIGVAVASKNDRKLLITLFLPFSNDIDFNPQANTLADYSRDYSAEYYDVLIQEQKELNINGFQALRQFISIGKWRTSPEGSRIFEPGTNGTGKDLMRYVFFDGEDRFISMYLGNYGYGSLLDRVASTFRFIE